MYVYMYVCIYKQFRFHKPSIVCMYVCMYVLPQRVQGCYNGTAYVYRTDTSVYNVTKFCMYVCMYVY